MKLWEVTITYWLAADRWWWMAKRKQDRKGPGIHLWYRHGYCDRLSAFRAAKRDIARLGLVEKAKAGKD